MYILQCHSLNKIFKQGDDSIYAVKDCNLKVREGSFSIITGASGSGKTTLLHLLAAFDHPTSGTVTVEGKNIYEMNEDELSQFRNSKIGFVFQSFHLLPILTAEENILLPTLIKKQPVSNAYMSELCDCLEISNRLKHFPSELSGGQQQRVAIARAMINCPKILLADEPSGNLDKRSAKELMNMLFLSNKKFGQTILMVTHDQGALEYADNVFNIDDGVLKQIK